MARRTTFLGFAPTLYNGGMDNAIRQALRQLIADYGPTIVADPRRCENLLRDYGGDSPRELNVLVAALRERIAADLLMVGVGLPAPVLLLQLSQRLSDQLALTEVAAWWAVESWALALGVIAGPVTPPPPAPPTAATTVTVSRLGRDHFTSIGAAIQSVAAGSRIVVRAGSYRESLRLDRPVEIVADGLVSIEADAGPTVLMHTTYAELVGLTLGSGPGRHSTVVVASGELLLVGCTISGSSVGIEAGGVGSHLMLRGCRVTNAGVGVRLKQGSGAVLEDCEIAASSVGVEVGTGVTATLLRCTLHNQGEGINFQAGSGGLVEGCTISDHWSAGIVLAAGANPTIRACRITANERGIAAHPQSQPRILATELHSNRRLRRHPQQIAILCGIIAALML